MFSKFSLFFRLRQAALLTLWGVFFLLAAGLLTAPPQNFPEKEALMTAPILGLTLFCHIFSKRSRKSDFLNAVPGTLLMLLFLAVSFREISSDGMVMLPAVLFLTQEIVVLGLKYRKRPEKHSANPSPKPTDGLQYVLEKKAAQLRCRIHVTPEAGKNPTTVHIPFCPPFETVPHVRVRHPLRVQVGLMRVMCHGIRFEVKPLTEGDFQMELLIQE
ncbi:MAG: hypothetical protein LBQ54_12525 [Planctomycetaceae bacterium]|nr:hypothetical protein [Planctomycetaceae bacterium]